MPFFYPAKMRMKEQHKTSLALPTGLQLFSSLAVALCLLHHGCYGSYVTDEESLRTALLTSYSTKVRPDDRVNVSVNCVLISINKLEITEESMSTSLVWIVMWEDSRLSWTPSSYGGITKIYSAPQDIWTPAIVVENAVSDVGVIGGSSDAATPVSISSSGIVNWAQPQEVTTSCQMTIANYPFETQTCKVTVFGWGYDQERVYISGGFIDDIVLYNPSGQFDLIKKTIYHSTAFDLTTSEYFRRINFELKFRRLWQFYGQNLITPIIFNSLLMNGVFLLPIESGEKMGYSLTVLLSYVVFLTWVTESLPPVSNETSILQVYLAVVLSLGTVATLLTTWILHLYHKPSESPVCKRLCKFATLIMVPFLRKFKSELAIQKYRDHQGQRVSSVSSEPVTPIFVMSRKPPMMVHAADEKKVTAENDGEGGWEAAAVAYTWQELAVLFDSFFMWMFLFSLLMVTTIILAVLYGSY